MAALALSANTCEAATQAPRSPEGYDLSRDAADRHTLPGSLAEVSGLVVDVGGKLFAHNDELGVIYELDPETGDGIRRFGLGDPTVTGDFEGIAALGDSLYVITSGGILLRFTDGADRSHVTYERFRTGLGARCEIEGLAEHIDRGRLLVACKQARQRGLAGRATVFSIDPQGGDAEVLFSIPWDRIRTLGGPRQLHPSGLAVTLDGERVFVVAAQEGALLEVTLSGEVVGVYPLGRWHAQPEGIAFLPDGALLIADEGAGGRPRLTVYTPVPAPPERQGPP